MPNVKCASVAKGLRRAKELRRTERLGLLAWGKKYVPDYLSMAPSEMHLQLAAKLGRLKPGEKLITEGPRGSAKSTILGFLYPLRRIVEGRERFIMIGAETATQAKGYLNHIKHELEANERIEDDYPEAHGIGPTWGTEAIVANNGTRVEAFGALSAIRGKRQRKDRPTLVIVDDPEGDMASYSTMAREHIYEWFHRAVLNIGTKRTVFIVCGTRIHRDCLTAKLAEEAGWQPWIFKSICEWPARMDLWEVWAEKYRDMDDEEKVEANRFYQENKKDLNLGARVLWPERESLLDLMRTRVQIGETAFESEHQNNPIDAGQMEWSPELFEGEDIMAEKWPENPDVVSIGCDPSKGVKGEKRKGHGDYTAVIALAQKDGVIYVDARIQRGDATGLAETLFLEIKRRKPNIFVIETNQFQELIANELERIARFQGGLPIPIMRVENREPKDLRIRRLGAYLNVRAFRFLIKNPDVRLLISQLRDFPNGKHDDGPDAMEMAMRGLISIDQQPTESEIAQTAVLPYM